MNPKFDEKYVAIKNYTEDMDKLFQADLSFNIDYEPLIAISEMTNTAGRIFIEGIRSIKNMLTSQREMLHLLARIIDNIVAFAFIFVLTRQSLVRSDCAKLAHQLIVLIALQCIKLQFVLLEGNRL